MVFDGSIFTRHILILAVDDDFADFQAAPVQAGGATPAPAKPNLMDLLNATPSHRSSTPPTFGQSSIQPSLFGSPRAGGIGTLATTMHRPSPSLSAVSPPLTPQVQLTPSANIFGAPLASTAPIRSMSAAPTSKPTPTQSKPTSSNFDDLWSMSLGGGSKPATSSAGSKSMKALEKEKAQASLWGGSQTKSPMSSGNNNDIFGSFGNAGLGNGGKINGGNDDLLL